MFTIRNDLEFTIRLIFTMRRSNRSNLIKWTVRKKNQTYYFYVNGNRLMIFKYIYEFLVTDNQ